MDYTRLLRLTVSTQKLVNVDCVLQLSCSSRCSLHSISVNISNSELLTIYRGQTVPIERVRPNPTVVSGVSSHPLASLIALFAKKNPYIPCKFQHSYEIMSACTQELWWCLLNFFKDKYPNESYLKLFDVFCQQVQQYEVVHKNS